MKKTKGFTLIEIMVAIGLFAIVMMIASGAYLIMINANRNAQAVTTGINNLSFALESMTRTIRTGTNYKCSGGYDCSSGTSILVTNADAKGKTKYEMSGTKIMYTTYDINGVVLTPATALTDSTVTVNSLQFYAKGTQTYQSTSDLDQSHIIIVVKGSVPVGPGRQPEQFTVETSATMRGTDL